jgi:predicted aconitase/predicted aconitase with swiveling domain
MSDFSVFGRSLVSGEAEGEILYASTGISFWGGVHPSTGEVIDGHHSLSGQNITGKILAIPGGRGSCTGSSVLLELITNGHAPAALVFSEREEILTLGVIIADVLFQQSIPVLYLDAASFAKLESARFGRLQGTELRVSDSQPERLQNFAQSQQRVIESSTVELDEIDQEILDGSHGKAAQVAMSITLRMANLQGASKLINVTQAHIDGCIYTGPASLRFAEKLRDLGARVRVPTTLNSISVDQRRWRDMGVKTELGEPSSALADVYMGMGAKMSFTCAPYLLESAPKASEQVVWAESNAVVYANSVIGARTQKYPDYLDICIALTGRAPMTGCHLDQHRQATVRIDVELPDGSDDSFWPLLGYHAGLLAGASVPVVCGLEEAKPDLDDLKAFGAAFATSSAAAMFHIAGVTPEAATVSMATGGIAPARTVGVEATDLLASWRELDSADHSQIDLVALGNPHFSLTECAKLAALCEGREKNANVRMALTLGRAVHEQARVAGYISKLEKFGALLINDTCWCMLGEPVIPPTARTLMTNSGKYAHYAPNLTGRKVHFGSLAACVNAACSGHASGQIPEWLAAGT